jgi:hypothetical protein
MDIGAKETASTTDVESSNCSNFLNLFPTFEKGHYLINIVIDVSCLLGYLLIEYAIPIFCVGLGREY